MTTLKINGKELKVGSLIKSPKAPTNLNVRVASIYKNGEIVKVFVRIGCCQRLHLNLEDVSEILS